MSITIRDSYLIWSFSKIIKTYYISIKCLLISLQNYEERINLSMRLCHLALRLVYMFTMYVMDLGYVFKLKIQGGANMT